jgi:hypothetical protein
MAAPVFTAETVPDHLAAYRARIEQRRVAIESRPPETRFWLTEPSEESVAFVNAMRAAFSFMELRASNPDIDWTKPHPDADKRLLAAHVFDRTSEENLSAQEPLARARSRLLREFIEAARGGDAALVRAFMEEGFPIALADRKTGETALHAAAGSQARPAIRVLIQHWPDFKLRDNGGRLASELAYLYGQDPALARLLGKKEREAAAQTGSTIRRRPRTPGER